MNMSYCRFNNTEIDLQDCLDTLSEGKETLSKDEFESCKRLFHSFVDFCYDEGIIEDEDGQLNDRLLEFFEHINKE